MAKSVSEIDEKIAKLKAQKQAILNRTKRSAKKARDKKLIDLGIVIESLFGKHIVNTDIKPILENEKIKKYFIAHLPPAPEQEKKADNDGAASSGSAEPEKQEPSPSSEETPFDRLMKQYQEESE